MKPTRRIQFCKHGENAWDAPIVVDDFRWEDPDLVILNAKGEEIKRVRVSALDEHRGWLGGTVWIPD
jgi:hypothetical protein